MICRISRISTAAVLGAVIAAGQQLSDEQSRVQESKRIFGIIPNSRTFPSLANYEPLTIGEKFKLASEDAFDREPPRSRGSSPPKLS